MGRCQTPSWAWVGQRPLAGQLGGRCPSALPRDALLQDGGDRCRTPLGPVTFQRPGGPRPGRRGDAVGPGCQRVGSCETGDAEGEECARHVSILRTGLFGQETESPKRNAVATGQPRGGGGVQNPLASSSGLSPQPRARPPLCWRARPWATVDHVTGDVGAALGDGTGWGLPCTCRITRRSQRGSRWIHGDPTVLGRRELMSSQVGVLAADLVVRGSSLAEAGRQTLLAPLESLFVPKRLSLKSRGPGCWSWKNPAHGSLISCVSPFAQSLAWGPSGRPGVPDGDLGSQQEARPPALQAQPRLPSPGKGSRPLPVSGRGLCWGQGAAGGRSVWLAGVRKTLGASTPPGPTPDTGLGAH